MTNIGRLIELMMTVVLIIGGYQFYFWAQRQRFRDARFFETRFDGMIAFDPRWVWIYSGLYYPMILLAAFCVPNWEEFGFTVGCFLALLAGQVLIFISWPVEIPATWRSAMEIGVARINYPHSMRMLDFVWSYDKLRNSLPSMHVSVAMMVDLTIWKYWPAAGHIGLLFPLLIAISALKTKQHYVVDVIPGAVFGAAIFFAWHQFIT